MPFNHNNFVKQTDLQVRVHWMLVGAVDVNFPRKREVGDEAIAGPNRLQAVHQFLARVCRLQLEDTAFMVCIHCNIYIYLKETCLRRLYSIIRL